MAILSTNGTFSATDTVTSTKLNNIANAATFDDPVDNSTLELYDGKLRVKASGVGATQIATDAVTTIKIEDDAIVTDKIEDNAVTPAKLSTTGEFTVETMTANQGANQVGFTASTTNSAQYPAFGFNGQTGDNGGRGAGMYLPADGVIAFSTAGSERMRIQSSGILTVGTTSTLPSNDSTGASSGLAFHGADSGRNGLISASRDKGVTSAFNRTGDNGDTTIFKRDGATVGSISVTTSSTSYNTSSDYRLKEDVIDIEGSLERLKALKPCNFRWISDGTRVDGFLAHEAQEVVPEAVTGTKDAVDEQGNPDYQGIDQAKLVPLLTKALQEAVAKIESLETRVKALENA
jgi:hypothetical protein